MTADAPPVSRRRVLSVVVVWTAWAAVLVSLWLCTGVMALDGIGIALLYMTCGLGFPLLFVGSLAAYVTLLTPAVTLLPVPKLRWVGGPFALGLVVAFALLPHRCAESDVAVRLANATAGDVVAVPSADVRSLAIVRPAESWAIPGAPLPQEACDEVCRALLLGGEVDWVQITLRDFREQDTQQVRVAVAHGADCSVDGEGAADDTCVIHVPVDGTPAALTVTITDAHRDEAGLGVASWGVVPRGVRRVEAVRAGTVVLRTTTAVVEVAFAPTILGTEFQGMSSEGLTVQRTTRTVGPTTLDTALRALGFQLTQLEALRELGRSRGDWRTPPDDELTRQVVSVLDLPGDTLAPDQQQVVGRWLASARAWSRDSGWDEGRLALVDRVLRDVRVGRAYPIDQLARDSSVLATALLPTLLDLTETRGTPDEAPWSTLWYGYRNTDAAVLTPHADRLAALLDRREPGEHRLLPLAGRIGRDPSPWLLPLVSPAEPDHTQRRVLAACLASTDWSATLVPPLRELWSTLDLERDDDLAESVAHALQRHGDSAWVEAQVAALDDAHDRLGRRILGRARFAGTGEDLCR